MFLFVVGTIPTIVSLAFRNSFYAYLIVFLAVGLPSFLLCIVAVVWQIRINRKRQYEVEEDDIGVGD